MPVRGKPVPPIGEPRLLRHAARWPAERRIDAVRNRPGRRLGEDPYTARQITDATAAAVERARTLR